MTVVDAHKGPVRWRVELTGRAAHSSMPHYGVNAIAYAGRLIGELLPHGGGAEGLDPQPALRSAVDHDAGHADRGRDGLQRRAGAVLVRLGDAGAAGLRSDDAGPAAEGLRGREMPAGDAARGPGGRHQDRRDQPRAGLRRRHQVRHRAADPEARRPERDAGRVLLHRSRPVPGRRRPRHHLRPRRHRPGAHGQRVRRTSRSWRSAWRSSAAWRTGRRLERRRTRHPGSRPSGGGYPGAAAANATASDMVPARAARVRDDVWRVEIRWRSASTRTTP